MGYRLCIAIKEEVEYAAYLRLPPEIKIVRYEVSRHAAYDEALEAHDTLRAAHDAGRLFKVTDPTPSRWIRVNATPLESIFARTPSARLDGALWSYLAVRDEDDPGWRNLPVISLIASQGGRGTQDEDAVYRRWGKAHGGYHGHEGGWIHRGTPKVEVDSYGFTYTSHAECRRTGHQGWHSWRADYMPPRSVIQNIRRGKPARYWLAA